MEADAAGQLGGVGRGGGPHPGLQGLGWDFEEDLMRKAEVKSVCHQGYPGSWTLDERFDAKRERRGRGQPVQSGRQ